MLHWCSPTSNATFATPETAMTSVYNMLLIFCLLYSLPAKHQKDTRKVHALAARSPVLGCFSEE